MEDKSCRNCKYHYDYHDGNGNHDGEGCKKDNLLNCKDFCELWEEE